MTAIENRRPQLRGAAAWRTRSPRSGSRLKTTLCSRSGAAVTTQPGQAAIKAKYDRANLFRVNQNIRPAQAAAGH